MAMDATTVDAGPTNAASTVDDARAARSNTLLRHMDSHSTTQGQLSGTAIDATCSNKKVTMVEAKAVQGVHCG
jgi:hypothetical protein